MRRTLVLNAGFEPLVLVSWQRAVCLLVSAKAEVVTEYKDSLIRSVSTRRKTPSVIRLHRYVRPALFSTVRLTRKNILARDGLVCQYCEVPLHPNQATIDHIHPKSRGGLTTWENVVTACVPCNSRKGNAPLERTSFRLIRPPRKPRLKEIFLRSGRKLPADWAMYLT